MPVGQPAVYECDNCGFRVTAAEHAGACPRCGATLQNISVTRE